MVIIYMKIKGVPDRLSVDMSKDREVGEFFIYDTIEEANDFINKNLHGGEYYADLMHGDVRYYAVECN